jgi:hypothetical protein
MLQALVVLSILVAVILGVKVIEQSRLIKSQAKQIADLIGLLKRAKSVAPHLYEDIAA